MIEIRLNNEELWAFSDLEYVYLEEKKYPIIYLRKSQKGQILVAINASPRKKEINLDRLYTGNVLLSYNKATLNGNKLILPARGVYILKLN